MALRLAFLDQHLEQSDPLPLIMDDILINFDDERTKATLAVLQAVAEKTQIIYFTHHQSIVDTAKQLKDNGTVYFYDLMAEKKPVNN